MAKQVTTQDKEMTAEERRAPDDDTYFASLDEDDAPELTEELLERARPARKMLSPETLANWKRARGRPKQEKTKTLVSLRLDPEVLAYFQEEGEGWRARINETLAREVTRARRKK